MAILKIDLQEGFLNELVVIRVNEREVFRKNKVTTRTQIGYSDSCETSVDEGPVKVEVTLPLRDATESIQLQVSAPTYLGVSVMPEGKISHQISHEPFGYL